MAGSPSQSSRCARAGVQPRTLGSHVMRRVGATLATPGCSTSLRREGRPAMACAMVARYPSHMRHSASWSRPCTQASTAASRPMTSSLLAFIGRPRLWCGEPFR